MRWFRHDSAAHTDAKLKKVRHKYGITGYGLYWYCLELVAGKVEGKNVTFELEDDADLIALEWNLDRVLVNEMLHFMVQIELFEMSGTMLTCMKMARRLDDTTSRNPEIRKLLKQFDSGEIRQLPTNSEDSSDR